MKSVVNARSGPGLAFQRPLEVGERLDAAAVELAHPAVGDLLDRRRIEEMQLLAPVLPGGDQIGLLQQGQVLGHRLAAHVQSFAQLGQGLSATVVQPVQELAPTGVGQGLEHGVVVHGLNMQPKSCMSSAALKQRSDSAEKPLKQRSDSAEKPLKRRSDSAKKTLSGHRAFELGVQDARV